MNFCPSKISIKMKVREFLLFFTLFLSLSVIVYRYSLLEGIEMLSFDLRSKMVQADDSASKDVAVILIDEASIKMMNLLYGRWPWPREVHGEVIKFLSLGKPKAIVYDILFTERSDEYNDKSLAKATSDTGNVYHAMQLFFDPEVKSSRQLPAEFVNRFSLTSVEDKVDLPKNNEYAIPYRELYLSSKGLGVVEFSPDEDGIYRRTPLIRAYGDKFFPILSLAVFISDKDVDSIYYSQRECIISGRDINISIPLHHGKYVVKLYGSYNSYSMSGILASIMALKKGNTTDVVIDPSEFRDKVVFIGASSVGLEDLKPTPLSSLTPGVFLHASIYSNLVNRDFFRFVDYPYSIILTTFILAVINFTFFFHRIKFILKLVISMLVLILYLSVAVFLFYKSIVLDMAKPSAVFLLNILSLMSYVAYTEEKEKRKIRKNFEKYVSKAAIEYILDKPEDAILETKGSKVELSILFSDIRGFTNISESIEAEKVVELLNLYLDNMTEVIFKNEGTVDKFIGDAILAFWGAPVKMHNHPDAAVKTALEMLRALQNRVNPVLSRMGLPEIGIGIGINTAEVVLGNIGSKYRVDYTVIGDGVNLASRLESLTRHYGVNIIVSEHTFNRLTLDDFCWRTLDIVKVKGKEEPVKIYEIMEYSPENQKLSQQSIQAFDLYLSGDWERAILLYQRIQLLFPKDNVSKIFLDRCKALIDKSPKDWKGVWEYKEK